MLTHNIYAELQDFDILYYRNVQDEKIVGAGINFLIKNRPEHSGTFWGKSKRISKEELLFDILTDMFNGLYEKIHLVHWETLGTFDVPYCPIPPSIYTVVDVIDFIKND